jgi:hypothetical protein
MCVIFQFAGIYISENAVYFLVWFFLFATWSQLHFTVQTVEYAGREELM